MEVLDGYKREYLDGYKVRLWMEVEVVDWKKWMDIRGLKIWMD